MGSATRPGCPTAIQLDQFAWGTLDTAQKRFIEDHLRSCSHCKRALEELKKNREFANDLQAVFEDSKLQIADTDSGTATFSLDASDAIQGEESDLQDANPTITFDSGSRQPVHKKGTEGTSPAERTLTVDSKSGSRRDTSKQPYPTIQGYDILREISRGGQGVVYEAIQQSTGRTVAVKAMLNRYLVDERSRWRFEQEVKLIAGIKHTNIVTIFDSGSEEGLHYYVMEFVNGQPLDTYIRLQGPSLRETIKLFTRVCEGVAVAHRNGVIHRDLKPSNILVNTNGVPQVLDFGLAKVAGQKNKTRTGYEVTQEGQVMGTLRYMSPEQTLGDPDAVDSATDIYSLGVILYEILVGKTPYETDTSDFYESLGNIREKDPVRPSAIRHEVDRDLEAITLRALEKDAGRRYQSVAEFQCDLIAWLEGRAVIARSASSLYVLKKIATRNKFPAAVVSLLLISMTSFAIIGMHGVLYGRQMAERRVEADTAFQTYKDQTREANSAILRELSLGWLLWHYEKGDLGQAQKIRARIAPDSSARAFADYLLDPSMSEEKLSNRLSGSEMKPILHFALGERAFQANNLKMATAQLKECLKTAELQGQTTWEVRARARLQQIAEQGKKDSL